MSEIKDRKKIHIQICLNNDVQAHSVQTGFDDVFLVHKTLPEISLDDINTTINFFNHTLKAPIIIEPMTGGTDRAAKINANLAKAAETLGLAMGVGSQRAAIEDRGLEFTFRVVRENAPTAFIMGNLGASQLLSDTGLTSIKTAIEMIDANAFTIHLNPLQEVVQPEGNTSFKGVLEKIREVATSLSIPLIVKETGAGIAANEAKLLESVGVDGIDVSGAGGTSWAAVESYRAKMIQDESRVNIGKIFWEWGIPTAISIAEARQSTRLKIIASGGIRTGIEAAKAIALGADAVGLAFPLLKPALEDKIENVLRMLISELRTAMFLVGAKSIKCLANSPLIVIGKTAEWLRVRGFEPRKYAMREQVN